MVEHVDDRDTTGHLTRPGNLEASCDCGVDLENRRQGAAIGESAPIATAPNRIRRKKKLAPPIARSGGRREHLIIVERHPVPRDVCDFCGIAGQELSRGDMGCLEYRVREIEICRERICPPDQAEIHSPATSPAIAERCKNIGAAELGEILLVVREEEEAVQAEIQLRRQLLSEAGVEKVILLRLDVLIARSD